MNSEQDNPKWTHDLPRELWLLWDTGNNDWMHAESCMEENAPFMAYSTKREAEAVIAELCDGWKDMPIPVRVLPPADGPYHKAWMLLSLGMKQRISKAVRELWPDDADVLESLKTHGAGYGCPECAQLRASLGGADTQIAAMHQETDALRARVEKLTGLVEQAYREGYLDGSEAGERDYDSELGWHDPELGWHDSEARAALTEIEKETPRG